VKRSWILICSWLLQEWHLDLLLSFRNIWKLSYSQKFYCLPVRIPWIFLAFWWRFTAVKIHVIMIYVCLLRQGMDCILHLLTNCILHSKLHFTGHWPTQTSVLSLLLSSLAVSWQRFLPREVLQLPAPSSSCHSSPFRTPS
jgi:hypothetical protein